MAATIVTLTMNPALDITTSAGVVLPTDKIRCSEPRYDPGGGGINVARIAHALGGSVSAIFPAGGPIGSIVTKLLDEAGVSCRQVPIAESTRESFTVDERQTGDSYRFVLPGPHLTFAEQAQCLDELRKASGSAEFVVASGSLPLGVRDDYYQRVADICRDSGALFVLDTSGGGLQHVTSGVFLLKTSVQELQESVGRELATGPQQLAAAHELIKRGCAQAVLVSLGSRGALLASPRTSQRFSAIRTRSSSGVGAGDAMVAAITVGLSRGWPLGKSVRFGIAARAATLMTPGTAHCNRSDVERLFELVAEPSDVDVHNQCEVDNVR